MYLAQLSLSSLGDMFESAKNIMDWLAELATLVAQVPPTNHTVPSILININQTLQQTPSPPLYEACHIIPFPPQPTGAAAHVLGDAFGFAGGATVQT